MKLYVCMVLSLVMVKAGTAAPLQLHNRIVFTRDADADKPNIYTRTVWTMNPQGGDQKRVWRVPQGYGEFGGFSRDGKWALSINAYNLYKHTLQTRRIFKILTWNGGFGTGIRTASFSPDGKEILCSAGDSSSNLDHSYVLRLQFGSANAKTPTSTQQLDLKKSRQGEQLPLTSEWSEANWDNQGKRIVVVSGVYDMNVEDKKLWGYGKEIWVMNRDWSDSKRLTNNDEWDSMPSFSPDGQKVAFVRAANSEDSQWGGYASNIYVYDLQSQTEKMLTSNTYEDQNKWDNLHVKTPLFSPDGCQIAYELKGINRMGTDGKNMKRLADGYLVQWIW